MSSGCGDVLSLEDLKTAKLHQIFEAEVITGKAGGVATGASIDYATNAVTGQVQKTMPAILRDIGFEPASFDFTTGGTLTTDDRNKAVLWSLDSGGDGEWYYWEGTLPKVIPASSTPATTGGVAEGAWRPVGDIALREQISDVNGATLYPELQMARWRDEGDIRGWGAKGDGTTDDTTAMQTAITACAGRECRIPKGVYIVTVALKINSNTNVYIAPGATVKRGVSTLDNIFRNNADGITGGYTANENIKIYGGGTVDGNADYLGSSCTLIACGHMTRFFVEDLKLINVGGRWHAIEFNSSKMCHAKNVYMSTNNEPTNGDGELIQIDNMENSGQFPWFGPYDGTTCYDITIEGCEFYAAGCGIGSHTESPTTKHYNINIINNKFFTNVYSVKSRAWANVTIRGNRCEWGGSGTAIAAIYVRQQTTGVVTSDFLIEGNTVFNWTKTFTADPNETFRGVWIDGDSKATVNGKTIISNNRIFVTGSHSITLDYTYNTVVVGNYVEAPAYTGKYSVYSWNSLDTLVSGNHVGGDVAVCGGTLTGQKATVVGNHIMGSLSQILVDTQAISSGNYVGGTNGLQTFTGGMGVQVFSRTDEARLDLGGTTRDTLRLTSVSNGITGNKGLFNATDSYWILRADSNEVLFLGNHTLPRANNTYALGSAAALWSTVYASSGTINTSDVNYKKDVRELSEAEIAVARKCAKLHRAFRMKDSDSGRIHVGTIAQLVAQAFVDSGLNPNDYGVYCYDKWPSADAQYDENGSEIVPAVAGGERYAIRYDEFNCFVNAGLNYEIESIEARLAALEAK